MLRLKFKNDEHCEVKIFKFPAGESGVSFVVPDMRRPQWAHISLSWESNDDIINLCLLVDAIRRQYGREITLHLEIPYFPYARQDRVCNEGEGVSVKVIADIINSLKFFQVMVVDAHSEVLGAVLDNVVHSDTRKYVDRSLDAIFRITGCAGDGIALVSPDAGANKKVLGYAKELGGKAVIRADKTRDTKTGKITGTVVFSEHLGDTHLLVIDDILDGGGTFIPLAIELRKITTGSISLLVSHGIFTKGVDIFEGVYDNLFVINNMYGPHPLIKEII